MPTFLAGFVLAMLLAVATGFLLDGSNIPSWKQSPDRSVRLMAP